jgi:DNA-binding HxlR family transcriptional regulator
MGKSMKKIHCDGLTDAQEAMLREIVGQVAGKWPLWTLHILYQSDEPLRFARLLERVDGISQKMLTQTLRQLERDGLLTRKVYAEVPPRVEYALTPQGREMMEQFRSFWSWIMGKLPDIEAARSRFDGVPGSAMNASLGHISR